MLHYSGHEATFTDPLVDCRQCKSRWRADHVDGKCPKCGSADLTEPRPFNLMFKTTVGPVDDGSIVRVPAPRNGAGDLHELQDVVDSTSRRLPFGVAQIGKAFRNEITPRNFIFRVREFEQMELEFFVKPGTDEAWHEQWVEAAPRLVGSARREPQYAVAATACRQDELAHYSKATFDVMYRFPHGVEELEGIANRTDFDLGSHTRAQGDFNLTAKVSTSPPMTAQAPSLTFSALSTACATLPKRIGAPFLKATIRFW